MQGIEGLAGLALPIGPITRTVAWYAVIFQLQDTRVFVARPAPRQGQKSVTNGMLEIGADLEPPELADLQVNAASANIRQQLGSRIGIGDQRAETAPGALAFASPLSANLGHAALLCLQNQDEVASKRALFHRQNDDAAIRTALKTTLPYFLGTVAEDQAARQQGLVQARRALRRIQAELKAAQDVNRDFESRLRSLVGEARVHGLLDGEDPGDDRAGIIALLRAAASFQPMRVIDDGTQRARELKLTEQAKGLRRQLRALAEDRRMLTEQQAEEGDYTSAVGRGMSRLSALHLVPEGPDGSDACPGCGSYLDEPDPTVSDMHATLEELSGQLDAVQAAAPRREQALRAIDNRASALRQELRGLEGALDVIAEEAQRHAGLLGRAEQQAYVRGRIDAYLTQIEAAGPGGDLERLESEVAMALRVVEGLEEQLDNSDAEDRLTHSLSYVSGEMTRHARTLRLEHGDRLVRLDLKKLTVVTDSAEGVAELMRIGSGKNWVGYHIAAHLALHQFFVANQRPVPRFLMLDQPTQPYYPSDIAKRSGRLEDLALDEDREAVKRLFQLMHQTVTDLSPNFQMIVSDHANLPDP